MPICVQIHFKFINERIVMGLGEKLFGTYSERQIKKIEKTAAQIEALASKYSNMSDEELSAVTPALKERLAGGETLDDILPDAFAAIREADFRVLGKRPFHVQLLGGIILHQGRIAEMKTGEGKTLVATLPAYLNALSGEGVHIVTVNDYLATRDSEEMGRVYDFMGLTTGLVVPDMSVEEKQEAYRADITYGTNSEFGFDYLRDNLVYSKDEIMQRGHYFAIVDEVDSILIDEARTPLIISQPDTKPTGIYEKVDKFVGTLQKLVVKEIDKKKEQDDIDADYIVDEKARNAVLTPRGARKAERFFGIKDYTQQPELAHHINQGIKAHGTMFRDQQYVVINKNVYVVDEATGRMMPGKRFSDGLHQAIEAKEKLKVRRENKTCATVTYQNYFRMYKKLSGMTGTALTEQEEFKEIYYLDVVEVPTNKPMIRIDHPDKIYKTLEYKNKAIIEQIKICTEKGQPVLVGTSSVDKSWDLSRILARCGIKHTVLNAKNHRQEAEYVSLAGKLGSVTICTSMAGRGTDIMLGGNPEFMAKQEMGRRGIPSRLIAMANGTSKTDDVEVIKARKTFAELYERYKNEIAPEAEKVKAAGGLFVLGTERHESRRIDNQLRGRSGRQGDSGESLFILSLEDDLLRLFSDKMSSLFYNKVMYSDDKPLDDKIFSNAVESAQKVLENKYFKHRKNVLEYDDIMNRHRSLIYKQRREVLDGTDDIENTAQKMISASVKAAIAATVPESNIEDKNIISLKNLLAFNLRIVLDDRFAYSEDELATLTRSDVENSVEQFAMELYQNTKESLGEEEFLIKLRNCLLSAVTRSWMEHLDAMDDLKDTTALQSYAHKDPITEYRIAGGEMFDDMIEGIRIRTVKGIFYEPKIKSNPYKGQNIQRNDPCPCGSGKKFKNCCGAPGKN